VFIDISNNGHNGHNEQDGQTQLTCLRQIRCVYCPLHRKMEFDSYDMLLQQNPYKMVKKLA